MEPSCRFTWDNCRKILGRNFVEASNHDSIFDPEKSGLIKVKYAEQVKSLYCKSISDEKENKALECV